MPSVSPVGAGSLVTRSRREPTLRGIRVCISLLPKCDPPERGNHVSKDRAGFVWDDPLLLEEQLSADERMVRDTARNYAQDKLMPRVVERQPRRSVSIAKS